jgi:hypothetical protein
VDEENRLKGLVTSKDILNQMRRPFASLDKRGQLLVGAAVGVKEGFLQRAERLIKSGANALVIDIAHGHRSLFTQLPQRIISIDLFIIIVCYYSYYYQDLRLWLQRFGDRRAGGAEEALPHDGRHRRQRGHGRGIHTNQYSNFLHSSCPFLSAPLLVHPGDA